jgi:putative ABC transport system permease protein
MFKNYFRISFRNLTRQKGYAFINILGLATGIAVCLLIFLVIGFETSFDNFHKKQERIFRVLTEYHHADSKNIFYGHGVPYALPTGLKSSFPQIEEVAPVFAEYNDQFLVIQNDHTAPKKFKEERGVFFMNPSFFRIFDFPLLAGSYETLKEPNNVLLSR